MFLGRKIQICTAHRCAPKVACGSICPHRLAVPEKIFALLACSIFSTATGAPPRCIRHWRRSAPHPLPPSPMRGRGLYQQSLHKNASAAPYKRHRVGRNLRLSRTDPTLCFGQPSPLRCILLSPQGLATLRGPRLYGVYRRVGASGTSPSDFWLLFFIEK